jgi:thiol-disulfide isomerase/thioredoxin
VRAMACVCFVAVSSALVGCSIFGKKPKDRADPPSQQPAGSGWPSSSPATGRGSADRGGLSEVSGILAGRVVDSYDNPPPKTVIQVSLAGNNKENRGAPIEKKTDDQGYFTIPGLQPGQHYQLIARTEGERKLAGQAFAIPPDARLLIHMSEDFATGNTPAAPGLPSIPGQKGLPRSGRRSTDEDSSQEAPKTPNSIPPQRDADIGRPIRISDQNVNPASPVSPKRAELQSSIRPEDIAANPGGLAAAPPVANIPGSRSAPSPVDAAPSQPIPPIASRVPSCVLTGRQLDNFALNDLNGERWEYRNHRDRGRITLLDFWGTWCKFCLDTIPELRILQERYGPYGLEIVAIAYEEGTVQEQIRKVENVRNSRGINYRLLLGSDITTCPVKTQFGVNNFPALFLVDENNRIIWRSEGLDPYKIQELEMQIKQQLHVH